MLRFARTAAVLLAALWLMALSSTAHAGNASVLTFTKAFGAANIELNGSTSLTFNLALNNVGGGGGTHAFGFTDTLPAGLVVATPNGLSAVTCAFGAPSGGEVAAAGTVTATAGTGTITLAGMLMPMSSNCSFSVNVTGTTLGVKNNSVTTSAAYIVGVTKTATASLTVVAAAAPSDPIPPIAGLPPVPGIGTQPTVLNLSAGSGPTMLDCLMATVRGLFGADAVYLGQSANGGARISQGGRVISFYAVAASTGTNQSADIHLGSSNILNIGTSCGNFNIAPALYNLGEFGAVLNGAGLSATISAQGVITLTVGGVVYVARPDYVVSPGTPGAPSLVRGSDGLYRFTDSAGNTQVLRPAFLDTDGLSAQLGSAFGGWMIVQTDGTALFTLFNGQQLVLTADLILSAVSGADAAKLWWQDATNHYLFRSGTLSLAQGYTSRPR